MTNFEKWRAYTAGLPSPDNFIDWSFRFMISAALQRRVWSPPEHEPIFSNMYITLVGDPGVGKGGPIRAASSILTEHKLEDANKAEDFEGDAKHIAKATEEVDIKEAQAEMLQGKDKSAGVEKPLLIPVAADAVTYEALVQSMAHCIRRINYKKTMPDGSVKMPIYSHTSQCFCLEEMASLFRKHQNDLINFLIQAYDCSESYEYRTKTAGRDRILRMCVNFLAGTTPDFMQETFDDAILNQGYSSRTFYIYGAKNRKPVFFRPELTEEQRQYRRELSAHVKKLTKLYGCIQVSDETKKWLQDWVEDFTLHPEKRPAKSPKMKAYYARINIHIMKVAMAIHFGETTSMEVPQSTFEEAIRILQKEEVTMQMALTVGGNNPLSKVAGKIVEHLGLVGKRTQKELLVQFWEHIQTGKVGLDEILNYLQATDQIKIQTDTSPETGTQTIYYMVKQ